MRQHHRCADTDAMARRIITTQLLLVVFFLVASVSVSDTHAARAEPLEPKGGPEVIARLGCRGAPYLVVDADVGIRSVTVTGTEGARTEGGTPPLPRRMRLSSRDLGEVVSVSVQLRGEADAVALAPTRPTRRACRYDTTVLFDSEVVTARCAAVTVYGSGDEREGPCTTRRETFRQDFRTGSDAIDYISLTAGTSAGTDIEVNEHGGGLGLYRIEWGIDADDASIFNTSGGTPGRIGQWVAWDTPGGNEFTICVRVIPVDMARVVVRGAQCRPAVEEPLDPSR